MKLKLIVILPIILIWSEVFSQKEDYHWMLGYSLFSPVSDTNYGRAELIFSNKTLNVKKTFQCINKLNFTNASICDTNGKLLFYTNGLEIFNNEHKIIVNGDSLNPGELAISNECCGYTLESGVLILPRPKKVNEYFIIHHIIDRSGIEYFALNMLSTLVDMHDKKGIVVYKNNSFFSDSLMQGSLTACRHANGRDWWIPSFNFRGNKCYFFILDPEGLRYHHDQNISFSFSGSGRGQANFSPDGTKYTFINRNNNNNREFFLADFDRCSGYFSKMSLDTIDKFEAMGVAFSPNSELLYLALEKELYQLVLYEPNPFKNKIKIDSIDGFESFPGFPSYFFLMQLAPDNKIYICNGRGPTYLSTIEFPDRRGKSCKVMQHNISIVANSSMPNFPYFRLGAAKGTVCDSLITSVEDIEKNCVDKQIMITPNPNNGHFNIQVPKDWISNFTIINFYNSSGLLVNSSKPILETTQIDLELSSGLYYIKAFNSKGFIGLNRFVINK